MWKLKLREPKQLAQSLLASKWQVLDSNSSLIGSEVSVFHHYSIQTECYNSEGMAALPGNSCRKGLY